MIYNDLPKDWKDLQSRVAQIFLEMGLETKIGQIVQLVRGKKEIDVFAEDKIQSPFITYICECKNWNTFVPQETVHSFRTVLQDYGANYGFIISRKGFQSGAYEVAQYTNIKLLTWHEFQQLFLTRWAKASVKRISKLRLILSNYTEPINTAVDKRIQKLDQNKQFEVLQLKTLYEPVALILHEFILVERLLQQFPQKIFLPSPGLGMLEEVIVTSGKELIDLLILHCNAGIEKFDALFGEYKYR
jgi:hypothetical protein